MTESASGADALLEQLEGVEEAHARDPNKVEKKDKSEQNVKNRFRRIRSSDDVDEFE